MAEATNGERVTKEKMREAIMFGSRVNLGGGLYGYRYRGVVYVPTFDEKED